MDCEPKKTGTLNTVFYKITWVANFTLDLAAGWSGGERGGHVTRGGPEGGGRGEGPGPT